MVLTALALCVVAQEPPVEMRMMRFPNIHGDTIVFTYASDLWVTNRQGGFARRLTSHPGQEIRARISPDGKWVAFTGQYEGNAEAYVMPIEGGEPKRLTFKSPNDNVIGWTPDGKIMVASTAGSSTNRQQRLWLIKPEGGLPIPTKVMEIAEGSFSGDGSTITYTRNNSYAFNWRRYRGGTQGRISIFNLNNNQYSEIASKREQSYFPMYVGNSIYYISDKNQDTLNLYRYEVGSKRETQLTKFNDADIRFPSTDGKTIVYERDGYLYTYDVASGDTSKVTPLVRSDFISARPMLRKLGDSISSITISPSGARVAAEARGEIFSLPARSGETRNFTQSSGARERWPQWSPDGRNIAYVSDETGYYEVYTRPQLGGEATRLTSAKLPINGIEYSPDGKTIAITTEGNELHLLDVASKKMTRVYKARYNLGSFDFSPDSKWIAYIDQMPNSFGAVHLYDVETGKATRVTDGSYDDNAVSFDMNGKYLYLISTRTFAPTYGQYEFSLKVQNAQRIYAIPLQANQSNPLIAPNDEEPDNSARPGGGAQGGAGGGGQQAAPSTPPVKIDMDRLAERAIVLPMAASNYPFIIGHNNGVLYWSGGNVLKFDMGSRENVPLLTGFGGTLALNPSRTKAAYYAGGQLGVVDLRPGAKVGDGVVNTGAVETVISPRDEWKQIFWEAWRVQKFNFYDPNMLGQNWEAIGKRYEKYLPYVAHRGDLNYVLGLMMGELGTGHAYVSGGDMGSVPPPIPVGQLGADYEVSGNNVRFKKIFYGANYEEARRGPLGEPGVDVKEGEYLLAIDGVPVNATTNPESLLLNKANRTVVLTVNSTQTMSGSRQVRVRPVGDESVLRYVDWVEENRRKVAEASNGRIGYFHVPDTAFEGSVEFIRGFYRETDKDAVIVDERWNGGGYVQPWFVDTLARRVRAGVQDRNTEDWTDAVAIEGPKVLLINGYAGSGGDFFPFMFRQSKLGPLIGTRTWGGLVGIKGGAPLVDGGSVTAPEFAIYDRATNEIIAENRGIEPDIEVDARPDLIAQGRDPQLEKAIEHLMGELRKAPPKKKRQTIPIVPKIGG